MRLPRKSFIAGLAGVNLVLGLILFIPPKVAAANPGDPCGPEDPWCEWRECQGLGCIYCAEAIDATEEGCR
jgi:hypothetical protein